jgi:hypothetical protein
VACACLLSLFGPWHSCPDLIAAGKYSQAQEGGPGNSPFNLPVQKKRVLQRGGDKDYGCRIIVYERKAREGTPEKYDPLEDNPKISAL